MSASTIATFIPHTLSYARFATRPSSTALVSVQRSSIHSLDIPMAMAFKPDATRNIQTHQLVPVKTALMLFMRLYQYDPEY